MKKIVLCAAAVVLLLSGAVLAFDFSTLDGRRSDCPGIVACQLTGEKVCQDRCPLLDAEREDCPGKITSELVCRDRCPLARGKREVGDGLAGCCRAAK